MRRFGLCLLPILLVLPVVGGQDPPKDDKKPPTPTERFAALTKEFGAERTKIIAQFQKVKEDEQKKLFEQYQNLGKKFAERFLALAEENPKDAVAADAIFWILANASDSTAGKSANEKAIALIAEMPLKNLSSRLATLRTATNPTLEAVFKRAEKDETDPEAGALLAWIVTNGSGNRSPIAQKAIDRLLDKYPDHAALSSVTQRLGFSGTSGEDTLRRILEKATAPAIKASAATALGKVLAQKADQQADNQAESDKVAAEAEKLLEQALSLTKENKQLSGQVEKELKALRTLRVGKPVPEIAAEDLDGQEFKLSDYRGKVVLLDFWGHW